MIVVIVAVIIIIMIIFQITKPRLCDLNNLRLGFKSQSSDSRTQALR